MTTVNDKISKAFSDETGNSGLVHLNTAQADAFIDYIRDESVILKNTRVKKMNAPIEHIAKIGIGEEIFFPAQRGQRLEDDKRIKVSGDKIKLTTKEINVEGMSFKEHLMRMISKKGANQLEKTALYSKVSENGDSIMSLFDGYIKTLYNEGVVLDANLEADRFISKEKLAKLYKLIPTKYRSSLNKFYVPNDLAIDYEAMYETTYNNVNRKGAFGIDFNYAPLMSVERPVKVNAGFNSTLSADAVKGTNTLTLTSVSGLTIGDEIALALGTAKEFASKVTEINTTTKVVTIEDNLIFDYLKDSMDEKNVCEVTLDGGDIILTDASNLIWGIQRDITIETERSARERATYFVITLRCDFAVENPQASGIIKNLKVK